MTGDLANLSFEDAMRELDGMVQRLEAGKATLDDAIAAYERGAALRACLKLSCCFGLCSDWR